MTITKTSHDMSGVPDTARDTLRGKLAPKQAVKQSKNKVWAVAFFNDGRRVVTGSHDKTLRILDVRRPGEMVGGPFKGHTDRVRTVAISPDDSRIVSGGDDTTVIIWDTESKQMVLNPLVKHTEKVNSVCFSPDGKRVASGSHDSTVVVWDAETGAVFATLDSQDHRSKTVHVWSVSFSPDGLKLASGSSDHTIRVWRTVNAECLLKIKACEWSVRSVVWSPDGSQLVSGSSDNSAKFWDSSNGKKIGQPCIGHTRWITCLAISSDNSFIATASDDRTVRLWCTKTHKQIGHVLEHAKKVNSVAISPDAELLVSGADDGNLQLWSIRDILEDEKVEESSTVDEKVQGEQLRNSETQSSCDSEHGYTSDNGNHKEPSFDQDSTSDSSDTRDASGSDDEDSLFDIFAIKKTVRDSGDLHIIEDLLTHEIDFDEDDNRRDTFANRSIVRARRSDWDYALQDAVKSIAIQPSLLGYISKGFALCGNKRLWDAMEAFDSAFLFSNSDPNIINLLLLIKAVALFYAGRHDEAVRRVQDLTTAFQHPDPIPCSVVNSYLRVQLAIIAFQDGRYSEAADQLDSSISDIHGALRLGLGLVLANRQPNTV
ncbi:WD40-repeat-containing domain protein [Suillus bovinus]|uniref:WD40-repeat-containing domain protein n=1 Tax=Suillus bovinus TaxID=48563 RepID=UPI001B87DE92|nr:WD40-repeat-containing domain protein [Suillus bovinus]KAG2151587.1 WD40-repeat-containing domain protein [Suillus bovinus]